MLILHVRIKISWLCSIVHANIEIRNHAPFLAAEGLMYRLPIIKLRVQEQKGTEPMH
jgi:hypothetical protein